MWSGSRSEASSDSSGNPARVVSLIWYAWLLVWAVTLLAKGGVSPRMVALTGALAALLFLAAAWLLPRPPRLTRPALFILGGLLGVYVLQLLPGGGWLAPFTTSVRSEHGLSGYAPLTANIHFTLLSFVQFLGYLFTALLVRSLLAHGLPAKRVLIGLCVVAVLEGVFALGSLAAGSAEVPFFAEPRPTLGAATGTFVNKNSFAGFMGMALVLAVGACYSSVAFLVRRRRRNESAKDVFQRIESALIWLSVSLVFFVSLYFSQSRGGLASALVGVFLFGLLIRRRHAAGVAVLLVVLGAVGLFLAEGVLGGEGGPGSPIVEKASGGRWPYWNSYLEGWKRQPVLGFGIHSMDPAFHPFQPPWIHGQISHAHSEYVNALFEGGLVWLSLCLAGIVLWLRRAWSGVGEASGQNRWVLVSAVAGVGVILFHSLVDFDLRIPGVGLMFAALLGLGTSLGREGWAVPRWLRTSLSFGGLVLSALLAWAPLDGRAWVGAAQGFSSTDPVQTEAACRRALELSPLDSRASWLWADAALTQGRTEEASRRFATSARLWPAHALLQGEVAAHFWERFHESKAPEDWDRAREALHRLFLYDPFHPQTGVVPVLSSLWEVDGDWKRFGELVPKNPASQAAFAGFLVRQGYWKEAVELFHREVPHDAKQVREYDFFAAQLQEIGQNGLEATIRDERLQLRFDGEAYSASAHAWERLGHFDRALERAQQAVAVEPGKSGFRYAVARIRLKKGDARGAAEACTQGLMLSPGSVPLLLLRAEAWGADGDAFRAEGDYRDVLRRRPLEKEAVRGLAQILCNTAREGEASSLLAEYLRKDPEDSEMVDLRSRLIR